MKEVIVRTQNDQSYIDLVIKAEVRPNDTFQTIRTRVEKFVADTPLTGRVEPVMRAEPVSGRHRSQEASRHAGEGDRGGCAHDAGLVHGAGAGVADRYGTADGDAADGAAGP